MERNGLTAQIAGFAAAAAHMAIPSEAIAAARRAFIDTIGVILAGRIEPAVTVMQGLVPQGDEAFAWPGARMASAREAALLNGLAGHVLDYDDVAQAGHPSVVLVPAILAEAQRSDLSGTDALRAYVIGYEVWAELARREADAYHLGSWHPTPILGIVAATAALTALDRLDADTARHALAIAASMASGVIANFGSAMKPLQAGRAAAGAIEAVEWASAGITGSSDALEGAHGLLRGISPTGRVDLDSPTRLPSAPWALLRDGLSVKRYPVCYASHRAIDAVIDLAREESLAPGDVASITARLGQAPAQTLRYAHPENGLQARFSLHHNLAAALVDRAVGFAQLEDRFVQRSDVGNLYALTRMDISDEEECPDQPGMAKFDRVTIATRDGRSLDSGPIRHPRGHARLPLSDDELDAKFLDCARRGGFDGAEHLLERLHGLEAMARIAELMP